MSEQTIEILIQRIDQVVTELRETNRRIDEGLRETNAKIDDGLRQTNAKIDDGLRHTNAKFENLERHVQVIAEAQGAATERAEKTEKRLISMEDKLDTLGLRANATDRRLDSIDRILRNGHATARKPTVRKPTTRKPARKRR